MSNQMACSLEGILGTCVTPTTDGTLVGDGTNYPMGFTLAQLTDLLANQNWNNATVTSTEAKVSAGSIVDTFSLEYSGGITNALTLQSLVCGMYLAYSATKPGSDGHDGVFSFSFNPPIIYGLHPTCFLFGGLYYPYISISFFAMALSAVEEAGLPPSILGVAYLTFSTVYSPYLSWYPLTFTLNGVSCVINIYYYTELSGSGSVDSYLDSITISTPSTWF